MALVNLSNSGLEPFECDPLCLMLPPDARLYEAVRAGMAAVRTPDQCPHLYRAVRLLARAVLETTLDLALPAAVTVQRLDEETEQGLILVDAEVWMIGNVPRLALTGQTLRKDGSAGRSEERILVKGIFTMRRRTLSGEWVPVKELRTSKNRRARVALATQEVLDAWKQTQALKVAHRGCEAAQGAMACC